MTVEIHRKAPLETRQIIQSLVDDVASLQNQIADLNEKWIRLYKFMEKFGNS